LNELSDKWASLLDPRVIRHGPAIVGA
jgi:hypothetical protein